jgi:hypothetical protein
MHRALERALAAANREAFAALFAQGVAKTGLRFDQDELFRPGITQAIVKERDRAPLEGVPPGDGFRSVIDVSWPHPPRPACSPPRWTSNARRAAPRTRGAS